MSSIFSLCIRNSAIACGVLGLLGCAAAHGSDASIVGVWSEKTPTACQAAAQDVSATRMGELKFAADGTYGVTWMPFESYVDYWGTYTFDPNTGALAMTIKDGNSIPTDARLSGTAHIAADGTLEISTLFFGTTHGTAAHTSNCPTVFHK